jgi:hypothetical protein
LLVKWTQTEKPAGGAAGGQIGKLGEEELRVPFVQVRRYSENVSRSFEEDLPNSGMRPGKD